MTLSGFVFLAFLLPMLATVAVILLFALVGSVTALPDDANEHWSQQAVTQALRDARSRRSASSTYAHSAFGQTTSSAL